jgi:hypothetical protein
MSDLVERVARPCTCHPSEAPVPCRKQYAFLDCIRAEARALALEEAAKVAENHEWMEDIDWWLTATKKEVSERAARECATAIRGRIKD